MKLIPATVPQGGQNSNFFDTEGQPIVGLTYFNVDVLDGTPSLKFQTPAPGQDPSNPSATWIDVLEISPGISTDADDTASGAPVQVRPALEIPNLILEGAGAGRNHFYLVQRGNRVPKYYGAAASTPGELDAQAFAIPASQKFHNQLARLSNQVPPTRLPSILRIALGVNQTTAAVQFLVAVGEPQRFVPLTNPRLQTVTFLSGQPHSSFFRLAPGEKVVGIATPAAFTTADLVFETVKPGLDPSIGTDANWLAVSEYVTEQTALTGATPGNIFQWFDAAQGQFLAVPDLNVIELPENMRLKGSANQGADRIVTLYIQ